ncbi:hypothetical protein ZIOFF_065437 [Zingiber officinale]|uniref:Uncharacterized protein n=2 Tax=Zingiber officinale TaxID=94328 RepID=A0A8J5EX47_ZINOF|nr:hypothetical protein ZIOFF_065437 [Zingiber officinale]
MAHVVSSSLPVHIGSAFVSHFVSSSFWRVGNLLKPPTLPLSLPRRRLLSAFELIPAMDAGAVEAPLVAATDGCEEKDLDSALRCLEGFLALLGFPDSSSRARLASSWAAFFLLGIVVPSTSILLSHFSRSACDEYKVQQFELCVLLSQVSLAAVSLACISRNLLKYGIRRFLFVDQHHGHVERFQKEYVRKIQEFFHLLLRWILPCFIVMAARETVHFVYTFHESAWRSIAILVASMLSWVYLTIILLSACMLFNLVCNLQIIHFEDFGKFLERDVETYLCLEEHMRLRFYLSKISHRFRIFLLLLFLAVTVSQFVTLFQTTGYSGNINFTNAGSLAVSSVVQVVVVVLCLNAASKISHRAQGIASLASRWHAYATCCPSGSQMRTANSSSNIEFVVASSFLKDYSESDLESLENVTIHSNSQLASLTSYHKRQALVIYLQSNPGGITIFGWTVDRTLVNTIFFLELTLVLFVLGKTIVFPSL